MWLTNSGPLWNRYTMLIFSNSVVGPFLFIFDLSKISCLLYCLFEYWTDNVGSVLKQLKRMGLDF